MDLIVVYFNGPIVGSNYDNSAAHVSLAHEYEHDASMASVCAALQNIDYIAIFTSDSSSYYMEAQPERRSQSSPSLKAFEQRFSQSNDVLYYTYWPNGIIEALIVMIPFLAILLVGICCTFTLQSDLKYDAEKSLLRKH